MPEVVGCEVVTCGIETTIVGPLSTTASSYRGLSSVVAAIVVVEISEPLAGGARANISGMGGGCACRSAARFSLALIKLGFNICYMSII